MTESAFELRRAVPDDARAMFDVMRAALTDSGTSVPHEFPSPSHEMKWLAYLIAEECGSWVAIADSDLVGFSAGVVRGNVGWLALLCVEPSVQGMGCGRALLSKALDDLRSRAEVLATLVDPATPRPMTMYFKRGMIPGGGFLALRGPTAVEPPAAGLISTSDWKSSAEAVGGLDERWMRRPAGDHAGYLQRAGFEFRAFSDEDGQTVGFSYWTAGGRLGPALVADPAVMPEVLAVTLAGMAAAGMAEARLLVPAENRVALEWLSQHDFRVLGMEIACASGPLPGAWDRYLAHRAALP
jgi:GNAT superfamily N-acetyltransferase